MTAETNHDSKDLNADPAELDRELGRMAADAVLEQEYPDFEFAFSDEDEPQLVYQNGDSFVVVETEVLDGTEDEDASYGKELRDGLVYERGTRQYLEVSIDNWLLSDATRAGAKDLKQALSSDRVEYILVSATVTDTEVTSIECTSFEL